MAALTLWLVIPWLVIPWLVIPLAVVTRIINSDSVGCSDSMTSDSAGYSDFTG